MDLAGCSTQQLTVSEGGTHAARAEPRAPARATVGTQVEGCSPLWVPSYPSSAITRLYRDHMGKQAFLAQQNCLFQFLVVH